LSSSYGTVELLETHPNAGRTLGQNQNGPSISPQDYISYQPSFRLTSVLSQTIDNAGTLKISSADTNNPANTSYGSPQYITIKLVPASNQAPIIKSVTSTSPTSIEVKWINPQNYKKVEIYVSNDNATNDFSDIPKRRYLETDPETTRCGDAQNRNKTCDTPAEYTATISDGIKPSTLYGVKVRGWIH